jgi:hypothetical protein
MRVGGIGGIGSLLRYGAHISHRGRRPELTPGCSSMHLHKDSDGGLGCAVILEECSGGSRFGIVNTTWWWGIFAQKRAY